MKCIGDCKDYVVDTIQWRASVEDYPVKTME